MAEAIVTDPLEVALFPIPDAVAFPGTVMPLHVFEPRYRRLVHDCVNEGRMLGVSHTLKTIHRPSSNRTLEEALQSNQATYKPWPVFSGGHCRILETTPDGRIFATVTMRRRLVLLEELQSLPYRIVRCRELEDEQEETGNEETLRHIQRRIHDRLIEIVGTNGSSKTAQRLANPEWSDMAPGDYSFRIFQVLRFEADEMQAVLETRSATQRLELIWSLLGDA